MTPPLPGPDSERVTLRDPAVCVATCGGVGLARVAAGTWGALVGVVLAGTLAWARLPFPVEVMLLVTLNAAAVPVCTRAARRLGGSPDPGAIVLDECASLPLGLLVVPAADRTLPVLALAFALHRLFDILKPFPCRQLERLPGGLGIMADDWAATAMMAIVLVVARQWPVA